MAVLSNDPERSRIGVALVAGTWYLGKASCEVSVPFRATHVVNDRHEIILSDEPLHTSSGLQESAVVHVGARRLVQFLRSYLWRGLKSSSPPSSCRSPSSLLSLTSWIRCDIIQVGDLAYPSNKETKQSVSTVDNTRAEPLGLAFWDFERSSSGFLPSQVLLMANCLLLEYGTIF